MNRRGLFKGLFATAALGAFGVLGEKKVNATSRPKSYVRNCYIRGRTGSAGNQSVSGLGFQPKAVILKDINKNSVHTQATDALFTVDNGNVLAALDGYAIVPIEHYYALTEESGHRCEKLENGDRVQVTI